MFILQWNLALAIILFDVFVIIIIITIIIIIYCNYFSNS